jgi:transcriptional regulator with XRE-family HTH domain
VNDISNVELSGGGKILATAIRGIRRKRGLKTGQVAQRMAMAQRSYELFEAGGGRLSMERIMAFAEATDSDPFALLLAVPFCSAQFAIDCADTKMVMIMIMSLQEFSDARGSDIVYLDPPNIIGAFQRVFKDWAANSTIMKPF